MSDSTSRPGAPPDVPGNASADADADAVHR